MSHHKGSTGIGFPSSSHSPTSNPRLTSSPSSPTETDSEHPYPENMGCTPSKPTRAHSRKSENPFPSYAGPGEFRASVISERRPHGQAPQTYEPYREPEHKPHRKVAQMYQTYQELDQQRGLSEGRRYSWEGHPSEKVFTTFDQLAERGIIPKSALKKK